MSSILEALRKLEQERARKRDAAPEIAADILRNDLRRKELPIWLWPALVAVALCIVALVAWRLLAPGPLRSDLPATGTAAVAPAVAPPLPSGEVVIEEVIDRRRPRLEPPPLPPVVAPSPSPAPLAPGKEKTAVVVPPPPPAAVATATTLEVIVSEIVWQEERSARMAVVNGLPVMEGDEAGESRVEEIAPDHVIFTRGNAQFSVRLSR